ncbi:MAG: hypothetical protein KTR28_00050 [Micavibrio sp.]|nr:hypothetical protein [Micavibrio sp.]
MSTTNTSSIAGVSGDVPGAKINFGKNELKRAAQRGEFYKGAFELETERRLKNSMMWYLTNSANDADYHAKPELNDVA